MLLSANKLDIIKRHIPLIILMFIGLIIRLYMAQLDPFLHPWDERFHALVARNMMDNPLVPMLNKQPFEGYDPTAWCCNHIWVHKQPLFLWQMALSMKLFGVSEFALRLPSALMGTLMIACLYRISYIYTHNRTIALIAATLLCFSGYQFQLISGIAGMDHNDLALQFYVLASIWAYAEYQHRPQWYWIILIGLFAGGAILNKWLIGLSVFLGWGLNCLVDIFKTKQLKSIWPFLSALLVCVIVFAPWQLYIIHNWPDLAWHEYEFNQRHITEALEGHDGTNWFYVDAAPLMLGSILYYLIPLGLILALINRTYSRPMLISFLPLSLFVFCFFSFIVKTKVAAHFFFIGPFLMLFEAIVLYQVFWRFKYWLIQIPVYLLIIYNAFEPSFFIDYLNKPNERAGSIYRANIYKSLNQLLPSDVNIVINIGDFEFINLMFYQNHLRALDYWPDEATMQEFEKDKVKIAAFNNHGKHELPEYIAQYPYLYRIPLPFEPE